MLKIHTGMIIQNGFYIWHKRSKLSFTPHKTLISFTVVIFSNKLFFLTFYFHCKDLILKQFNITQGDENFCDPLKKIWPCDQIFLFIFGQTKEFSTSLIY